MINLFQHIRAFHEKFKLPPADREKPTLLADDLNSFRTKFMQEELNEYAEAVAAGDLPKAADALVDLTYVVLGTAYLMNLPFNELWLEVHLANMRKARIAKENEHLSHRGTTYDVVKPAGWTPPDLLPILREHGAAL